MKKLIIAAGIVATVGLGWIAVAASDNSAQDAADYASLYGSCKAAR